MDLVQRLPPELGVWQEVRRRDGPLERRRPHRHGGHGGRRSAVGAGGGGGGEARLEGVGQRLGVLRTAGGQEGVAAVFCVVLYCIVLFVLIVGSCWFCSFVDSLNTHTTLPQYIHSNPKHPSITHISIRQTLHHHSLTHSLHYYSPDLSQDVELRLPVPRQPNAPRLPRRQPRLANLHEEEDDLAGDVAADAVDVHVAAASDPFVLIWFVCCVDLVCFVLMCDV